MNACVTSFIIVGTFDPDEATAFFGLSPVETQKIGDLRRDGSPFDFALWEFGRCDAYDVMTDEQVKKTIAPLLSKVERLRAFREKYDVEYYLSVVPELSVGEIAPCLSPSLDVIDFCHATRTQIDYDLYLYAQFT